MPIKTSFCSLTLFLHLPKRRKSVDSNNTDPSTQVIFQPPQYNWSKCCLFTCPSTLESEWLVKKGLIWISKIKKSHFSAASVAQRTFQKVTQKVYLNHDEEDVEQRNTASELHVNTRWNGTIMMICISVRMSRRLEFFSESRHFWLGLIWRNNLLRSVTADMNRHSAL